MTMLTRRRWLGLAKVILCPLSSGFDAFQWACWAAPAAGAGSGGRTVPHSFCSPEGQLLQRVPLRALQPHRSAVHPVTESQLQGLTLLMKFSHRTSPVGTGPGACSESSSSVLLCQTQEQKPQTGHPGSEERAEHHSSEVGSDVVPAAQNHSPGSFGYPLLKDCMCWVWNCMADCRDVGVCDLC